MKIQPSIIGHGRLHRVTRTGFGGTAKFNARSPAGANRNRRRILVSNASQPCSSLFCTAPAEPYSDFYNGIKASGRYELVAATANADLVLEISFVPSNAYQGYRLRLKIRDPRTSLALWTLEEGIGSAGKQANRVKNFEKAMSSLIRDVQMLTLPAAPPPNKGK